MVQAFQEQGREIPVSTGPSTAVAIPTIVPNVSPEKTGEFRYPTIRFGRLDNFFTDPGVSHLADDWAEPVAQPALRRPPLAATEGARKAIGCVRVVQPQLLRTLNLVQDNNESFRTDLHFSPRGEAKCVRGPSGLGASRAEEKGASRLARAGVLEQYVEHGKQAQRSPGGRIACFDRRVVRNAG